MINIWILTNKCKIRWSQNMSSSNIADNWFNLEFNVQSSYKFTEKYLPM